MTTETQGQNSWVNFGPFGAANRRASTGDTVFAEQKAGLLPLWASEVPEFARADVSPGTADRLLIRAAVMVGMSQKLVDAETALSRRAAPGQQRVLDILTEVESKAGVRQLSSRGTIGIYRGDFDNSVYQVLSGDPDSIRYLAAVQGKLLQQRCVGIWTADIEAGHYAYEILVPVADACSLVRIANEAKAALANATIEPVQNAARIWVVDDSRSTEIVEAVTRLADKYEIKVRVQEGRVEWVHREQFDDVIADFEAAHSTVGG
jgi:hypothetical protein